jgi:hypothetical protein
MVPTGPQGPRARPATEPAPSPSADEAHEKMMRPELTALPPAASQPAKVVHLPPELRAPPPAEARPVAATVAPRAALSVILGVLSLMCGGPLVGIIAIALGVSARRQIADSKGSLSGSGAAAVGIMLGVLGAVIHGFGYLAAFMGHR